MKQLLHRTLGLAFFLALAFSATAQGGAMEVIFTPDMDKAALAKAQEDAKANGLELTYTRLERKDERITVLAFVLKTSQGMGSAETLDLSVDKPFGFRYDPRAGEGEAAFSVGTLKPLGTK
ncbi:MAG: hypothetical protein JNM62_13035 [Flavobacteriales bacterium]|nr:hypothetical protein [Flavobacteriales bacterium]